MQLDFLKTNEVPRIVSVMMQYLGIKEIPGKESNPVIIEMARRLGIDNIYTNDDTAWCAVFGGYCLLIADKPLPKFKDKYDYMRAKSYMSYGNPVKIGDERIGDIAIFHRPGGFHFAVIIAETKNNFIVIGGNQNNSVNITEIPKYKLYGARRYYKNGIPKYAVKYVLNSEGKPINTNLA